ncbi:CshA/CshB family fibrillar adhesin-related protein [Nocardioides dongkuii]|uniref:CshA/CshB family fibrillar adhesin-related protein n=1 Tax=Nocardioides dongkuii TaxID=2760089 RepID=UPI001878CE87|nr:CshA/CshB family fibrillar adhesin-related protein [Nocardioides dongkuii]
MSHHRKRRACRRGVRIAAALALASVGLATVDVASGRQTADAAFADPSSKGRYVNLIDWVQWGSHNNEIVLQDPQSTKTVTTTRRLGDQTLRVDCTVSGLRWEPSLETGPNGSTTGQTLTPPLVAYTPGSWAGDALDDLYNIGGAGYAEQTPGRRPVFPDDFRNPNTMAIGLGNPNPGLRDGAPSPVPDAETDGARMSFDFSCSASLDGEPMPLEGIVFADAEASSSRNLANTWENNGPEWVQASATDPNATWRLLEQERTCTQASSIATWQGDALRMGVDGQECTYQNGNAWPTPDPDGHGPTAVAFLENDTGAARVSARVETQGRGYSAIALGYVLTSDFGDAPLSYGRAGALLQPSWTDGVIRKGVTTNLSTAAQARYELPRRSILGDSVDAEQSYRDSVPADGDDVHGTGDEDGLSASSLARDGFALPARVLDASSPQPFVVEDVACYGPNTGSAYVSAWIDWNGDGSFDPGERSATAECAAGGPHSVDLTWTVPADTSPAGAHTYLRVRIAEDRSSAEKPLGVSQRGEVEDYRLEVPARLVVDKTWVVDGERYPHGSQPDGLDARPTLDPTDDTTPEWGAWQTGHRPGDEVRIGESVEIDDAVAGCTVTRSTLTGDGLPSGGVDLGKGTTTATVTLPQSTNRYQVTNEVTCTQRLTLHKEVVYGDRSPTDWRLSATGPAEALAGHQDAPSGTTLAVSADVAYRLSEQGPDEYVATEEGWQCVDARTDRPVAATGDEVTLRPGQDVSCLIANATARLSLLKQVENGDAEPDDWTLSAQPGASGLDLADHETPGAATLDGAPTWEVRPGEPYRIGERPTDTAPDGYHLDRVELSTDGGSTWRAVDPDDPVTVPAGTHAVYRFVNQSVPSLALPTTGGLGRDAYLAGGVLLLSLGALLGFRRGARARRART